MIYLIAGRTGAGKDHLVRLLKDKGLKSVLSYATRPKRYENENTHIFISDEEATRFPEEDKVAKTKIGGYEYFATRQQVEECDIYVIDPDGIEVLTKNMPNTAFHVVYVRADKEQRLLKAAKRGGKDKKSILREEEAFRKRSEAEDAQFSAFEKYLKTNIETDNPAEDSDYVLHDRDNIIAYHIFDNNYDKGEALDFAYSLYRYIMCQKRIRMLTKMAFDADVYLKSEDGTKVRMSFLSNDPEDNGYRYEDISLDRLSDLMMDDDKGLAMMIRGLLGNEHVKEFGIKGNKPVFDIEPKEQPVWATMKIEARYVAEIDVDDPDDIEDIKKKAQSAFENADFGKMSDIISSEVINVEDEDGKFIYEA